MKVRVLIAFMCGTFLIPGDKALASETSGAVYKVYGVDAAIASGALATGILTDAFKDVLVEPRCPCDPSEVNSFDRGVIGNDSRKADRWSDITMLSSVGLPVVIDLIDVGLSDVFAEDMAVYVETMALTGALVNTVKYSVQRPRPLTYVKATDQKSHGGYLSFYSGHTTMTFAALSSASVTLNLRHRAGALPWVLTALIGSSVAAERVLAGKHFYSDIIVGAVTGIAIGTLVPMAHARDSEQGPIAKDRPLLLQWGTSFQ